MFRQARLRRNKEIADMAWSISWLSAPHVPKNSAHHFKAVRVARSHGQFDDYEPAEPKAKQEEPALDWRALDRLVG